VSLVFCLANIGLALFMLLNWEWRLNLFGTKMTLGLFLIYIKLQKVSQDFPSLFNHKKQVIPEESSHLLSNIGTQQKKIHTKPKSKQSLGVISVREKVLRMLKTVAETQAEDAEADVALQYCIKMIANN